MIWVLLFACAADPSVPPPGPAVPVDPATPTVPTLLGDAPGVYFMGEWTSKECASRAYARNIVLENGGGYAAIDLVSPCPAGTRCMWSGLVAYAGIWKQEGTRVLLREIGAPIERGSPHPTEFEATAKGRLTENGCEYVPGLTIPEGYTADGVRPVIPGLGGGPGTKGNP